MAHDPGTRYAYCSANSDLVGAALTAATGVVDSSWVTLSTATHARISPATTGIPPEEFGEYYGEADEGYAWHLGRLRSESSRRSAGDQGMTAAEDLQRGMTPDGAL